MTYQSKKPSQIHTNRHYHNWLMYDIEDAFLQRYAAHYKGTLYDLGCGVTFEKVEHTAGNQI